MIAEALILASSLIGCASCWAFVQKHRISAEMQKEKLKHDLEVLKPTPEPVKPLRAEKPNPMQQSLTQLLKRREALEESISELRTRVIGYSDKSYASYRTDALTALEDARQEQKELVLEEVGLLEMMQTPRARVELDLEHEPEDETEEGEEEYDRGQA